MRYNKPRRYRPRSNDNEYRKNDFQDLSYVPPSRSLLLRDFENPNLSAEYCEVPYLRYR